MDYTHSADSVTDATTGHRMHSDTASVPTVVSAEDLNSVIWSLMALLEAAGVSGARFNAADSTTYGKVTEAVRALAGGNTGEICWYAHAAVPSSVLVCDGSAKSRTTYARLFAKIGTTYGPGDGSTTFNLPDLRGEFTRGLDMGRGIDAGRTLGSWQDHGLASHTHPAPGGATAKFFGSGGANNKALPDSDGGASDNFEAATTGSTGGSETRPRNVALVPCIRT